MKPIRQGRRGRCLSLSLTIPTLGIIPLDRKLVSSFYSFESTAENTEYWPGKNVFRNLTLVNTFLIGNAKNTLQPHLQPISQVQGPHDFPTCTDWQRKQEPARVSLRGPAGRRPRRWLSKRWTRPNDELLPLQGVNVCLKYISDESVGFRQLCQSRESLLIVAPGPRETLGLTLYHMIPSLLADVVCSAWERLLLTVSWFPWKPNRSKLTVRSDSSSPHLSGHFHSERR